jgi:hypothetical protein
MNIAEVMELIVKYGLNNVLMVYLLFQFVRTTKELANVIHQNTVAMTEVFVVINECRKNKK